MNVFTNGKSLTREIHTETSNISKEHFITTIQIKCMKSEHMDKLKFFDMLIRQSKNSMKKRYDPFLSNKEIATSK